MASKVSWKCGKFVCCELCLPNAGDRSMRGTIEVRTERRGKINWSKNISKEEKIDVGTERRGEVNWSKNISREGTNKVLEKSGSIVTTYLRFVSWV